MATFEHSVLINAEASSLFDLMQDYHWRLKWDPFLSEARMIDCQQPAVGRRSWCVDKSGRGMETEYVSFRPPQRVAVRMTKGPWIFKLFVASWIYRPRAEGVTEVTFKYRVESRIDVGRVSDWVLRQAFGHEMKRRLHALKRCVEDTAILEQFAASKLPPSANV